MTKQERIEEAYRQIQLTQITVSFACDRHDDDLEVACRHLSRALASIRKWDVKQNAAGTATR